MDDEEKRMLWIMFYVMVVCVSIFAALMFTLSIWDLYKEYKCIKGHASVSIVESANF